MNSNKIFKNIAFSICLFLTTNQLNAWKVVSLENQSNESVRFHFVSTDKHINIDLPSKSKYEINPNIKYPSLPDTLKLSSLCDYADTKNFLLIQIADKTWISAECVIDSMPATWIQLEKTGASPKILSYSRGAMSIRSSDDLRGKIVITNSARIQLEIHPPTK